ncbi:MAG: cytochrome C554 [Kiritimatiellaeota bacterium]|nr:cytochrome C554 [Kiritimatiellota bacterium]
MKKTYLLIPLSLFSLSIVVPAGESNPADCVGVKLCRMCHKKKDQGNQYQIWKESAHAKAFDSLGSDKAKAFAKKAGVADAQKSGKCLKCHSSTYNFTEQPVLTKVRVEEGVVCETCHGYGKKYFKKSIMKDKAKAVALGLIDPPTKNCTRCHNEQSPTWDPGKYTLKDGTKSGFDVEQAAAKIAHPIPKKD